MISGYVVREPWLVVIRGNDVSHTHGKLFKRADPRDPSAREPPASLRWEVDSKQAYGITRKRERAGCRPTESQSPQVGLKGSLTGGK